MAKLDNIKHSPLKEKIAHRFGTSSWQKFLVDNKIEDEEEGIQKVLELLGDESEKDLNIAHENKDQEIAMLRDFEKKALERIEYLETELAKYKK